MTETNPTKPKQTRYRRTRVELDALRILAREAALRGEPLASIRARLDIPVPTLTVWARQDGYRQVDLAARAEAAEAAHTEADEIRQQADELWQMCEEMQDRPATGARRQVALARARTLALAEAGLLDAAEEEIAAVRRLARLLSFGRAGTGEMERFRTQAALRVREAGIRQALEAFSRVKARDAEEAAAREAAGLPPPPPPPPVAPWTKEQVDAFYAEIREKGRKRDDWAELLRLRRRQREAEEGA